MGNTGGKRGHDSGLTGVGWSEDSVTGKLSVENAVGGIARKWFSEGKPYNYQCSCMSYE